MSRSGGALLILNSLCQDIATVPRTERDFIHPTLLAKHGLCSLQPCCNHRQQNQEETFRVSEGEAVSGQRPAAQRLDVGSEPLGKGSVFLQVYNSCDVASERIEDTCGSFLAASWSLDNCTFKHLNIRAICCELRESMRSNLRHATQL